MSEVPYEEVAKHSKADDCWMVLGDQVFDLTEFAPDHPGGPGYLHEVAGTDATDEFLESHPLDIIERTITGAKLARALKGKVKPGSLPPKQPKSAKRPVPVVAPLAGKPPLEATINIFDFEKIARTEMLNSGKKEGWDYYSSGGDDEITLRENHNAYHRIWLRPRVMVNVKEVDVSCDVLGHRCQMPVFLSAVAMCGLGHSDGEVAWTKAAGAAGVIFMMPSLASRSFVEMSGARLAEQPLFFQLYVNPDREVAKAMVQKAEAAGCSALFITCDAPQLGNREKDRRNKATKSAAVHQGGSQDRSQGVSNALTSFIDPSLCWEDLAWFRSITKMKIVLKGIQTADDALLAVQHGCDGILLSNHGGRQLDTARSAIEVLPEVMQALKAEGLEGKIWVAVDGGVRRGTDIFKALALGAQAVGVGRPALYAMAAYGQPGIERMLGLLKKELEMAMRLTGCQRLADIKPTMVDTHNLKDHISMVPRDNLYNGVYIPPGLPEYGAAVAAAVRAEATTDTPPAAGAGLLSSFGALLLAIIKSVAGTVLGASVPGMLHRSAVFLVVFLVVHMLGNLSFLASDDAFNQYGHKLEALRPATTAIELYLLAAAVIHAGTAMLASWRKRSALLKPKGRWGLALSSIAVTGFMIVHVAQFRFGPGVKEGYSTTVAGTEMRDLARLQREVFSDPAQVGFYLLALGAIGTHVWLGWTKAVPKLAGLPSEHRANALLIGQAMTVAVIAGFALGPLSVYAGNLEAGSGADAILREV